MADENASYQQPTDPFAGVKFPDKFVKDGKPDLVTFVNSYGELETNFRAKTEDLRNTVKTELEGEYKKGRVEAADKYTLPKIDGVDEKELADNELLQMFRANAFDAGMTDTQFQAAVKTYVQGMQPAEPDMAKVKAELGENFQQRIDAVATWAKSYAKTPGETAALEGIATSADGVKLIERLAGLKGDMTVSGDPAPGGEEVTAASLRKMQEDPRYYDPNKRDPAFVKKVDEGYQKLYAKTSS